jgi:hypothetical protein
MKMADDEMQRIDKPTIYGAFWNPHPAGCVPHGRYRTKGFIGQSQQNCFAHFIEAIIFGQ